VFAKDITGINGKCNVPFQKDVAQAIAPFPSEKG
jgi:hypothetical protein